MLWDRGFWAPEGDPAKSLVIARICTPVRPRRAVYQALRQPALGQTLVCNRCNSTYCDAAHAQRSQKRPRYDRFDPLV
jgi:hypothetical protein